MIALLHPTKLVNLYNEMLYKIIVRQTCLWNRICGPIPPPPRAAPEWVSLSKYQLTQRKLTYYSAGLMAHTTAAAQNSSSRSFNFTFIHGSQEFRQAAFRDSAPLCQLHWLVVKRQIPD
jgi:hypothetical protein